MTPCELIQRFQPVLPPTYFLFEYSEDEGSKFVRNVGKITKQHGVVPQQGRRNKLRQWVYTETNGKYPTLYCPTNAHNVKKRRDIKTF